MQYSAQQSTGAGASPRNNALASGNDGLALHPAYHDHASEDFHQAFRSVCVNDEVARKLEENIERELFPTRLHRMVEHCSNVSEGDSSGASDIIRWLPHGRAFVFFSRDRLVGELLPRFMDGQNKFASFQRQLNIYGFLKLTGNHMDKGAYYHELFLRGRSDLSILILPVRLTLSGPRSAVRRKFDPESEPKFYEMTPLPPAASSTATAGGAPIATTALVTDRMQFTRTADPSRDLSAATKLETRLHRGSTQNHFLNFPAGLPLPTAMYSTNTMAQEWRQGHVVENRSQSTPPMAAASFDNMDKERESQISTLRPSSQSLPEMLRNSWHGPATTYAFMSSDGNQNNRDDVMASRAIGHGSIGWNDSASLSDQASVMFQPFSYAAKQTESQRLSSVSAIIPHPREGPTLEYCNQYRTSNPSTDNNSTFCAALESEEHVAAPSSAVPATESAALLPHSGVPVAEAENSGTNHLLDLLYECDSLGGYLGE